jgi:hypothetical protein
MRGGGTELLWVVMQQVGAGVVWCKLVCKVWHDALQGDAFWCANFLSAHLLPSLLTAQDLLGFRVRVRVRVRV